VQVGINFPAFHAFSHFESIGQFTELIKSADAKMLMKYISVMQQDIRNNAKLPEAISA